MKRRIIETAVFAAFIITVIISVAGFEGECEGVRQQVLRLHVIANSNSYDDQLLKLKVRDSVLEQGRSIFGQSKNKQSAIETISENVDLLKQAAEQELAENGSDYSVHIELGKSRFPTRTYGNITLPAGEYDAVKVIIGSGEGRNWWCVMFPPLCLPAAKGDVKLSDVMNEEELELVERDPKYEVRFWIVEKLDQLFGRD